MFTGLFSPPSDSSWIESLPDGHLGTVRTLQVMAWLCRRDYKDGFVSSLIREVLAGSPDRGVPETLFLQARDGITFREDPEDVERVADFKTTTRLGYGDCDDKCVWLCTALLNQNIPCRFRVQSYGTGTWDHVYCEYWDWGTWRWTGLDPTADGHSGVIAEVGWRQRLPKQGSEMIWQV